MSSVEVSKETVTKTYEQDVVVLRLDPSTARKLTRFMCQAADPRDIQSAGLFELVQGLIDTVPYLLEEDTKPNLYGQWCKPATFDPEWPHK